MKPLFYLKQGIVLFWSFWFTFAFLSNLFDLLKFFNWITQSLLFTSNNYILIKKTIAIYNFSDIPAEILFSLILILEATIAILFWSAFFSFNYSIRNITIINLAFTLSAMLWGLFLIVEEFFIAYQFESTHLILFLSQLICLLSIHLLPHED